MKKFFLFSILVVVCSVTRAQQNFDDSIAFTRNRTTEKAMIVLGSWAAVNIVSGFIIAGQTEGEAKYNELEKKLAGVPVITIPSITLEGDANGAPHPDSNAYAKKFSGKYAHRIINGGIGHNLPQEAPRDFANAIIEADSYSS